MNSPFTCRRHTQDTFDILKDKKVPHCLLCAVYRHTSLLLNLIPANCMIDDSSILHLIGTHGVKSSCACHFLLAVQPWPAGVDLATQTDGHAQTSSWPTLPVRQRHPLGERARSVSTTSPARSSCQTHCSFHTWTWSPGTVAGRMAAPKTGALLH